MDNRFADNFPPRLTNYRRNKFNFMRDRIINNTESISIPLETNKINVSLDTDIKVIKQESNNIIFNNINFNKEKLTNEAVKTIKYELLLTETQKEIFQKWFNGYIDMFNETISHFKTIINARKRENPNINLKNINKDFLNIKTLKATLNNKKNNIITKYNINAHVLDYAINDAISMVKSKISNIRNGYQKKQRLRYLKKTKNTKIFKVEKNLFTNTSFCPKIIGKKLITNPEFDMSTIDTVVIIQYNSLNNKYYLFNRKQIVYNNRDDLNININLSNENIINNPNYIKYAEKKKKDINDLSTINNYKRNLNKQKLKNNNKAFINHITENQNSITFDVGIREFLSGISNNHIINIGIGITNFIKNKLICIDKLNIKYKNKPKLRDRLVKTLQVNIYNKVNDYHWKIANYLVRNYKHINIGDFSSKSFVENDINKMLKRCCSELRMFQFKQKLKYKCFLNGVSYKEIDEYYTSKCCSNCSWYNENLHASKIFNCGHCNLVIDRDLNAAKNILMKSIKIV